MFEIRVICDPADADRVTAALTTAFAIGDARRYPTRDGKRTRLYLAADHHPAPKDWPTPEQAYASAPSINSEIGWTACTLATAECFTELDREFYLRKAALLDRIALLDEPAGTDGDATDTAFAAAVYLLDIDQPGVICDPRAYVRQQYARLHDQ
ncbi:hypothetical protein SAMN04487981_108395 [Streptomyces sp. cf386]|uniref:hypothetical protein n=1 Tax=Streptomyces sp. cf386 TaxID=1761904 RepID=UPI0008812C43|nr:hypothetical protein [Streptomyces sp. cf386]SDO13779.1 hypothetical protein SAMN04487981_108395 [Streptomyces sp. cf386]